MAQNEAAAEDGAAWVSAEPAELLLQVERLGLREVVGQSSQGRPLRAGLFGAAMAPPVIVVGGVHGNEPTSVAAVVDLSLELASTKLPLRRPVWLLPVLNPDGLLLHA